LAAFLVLAAPAAADEVLFLNRDRAGKVSVDLAKIKTFSTDEPIVLKSGDTVLRSKGPAAPTRRSRCRGNSHTENLGASLNAVRRSELRYLVGVG
jgi:hypothetical protein